MKRRLRKKLCLGEFRQFGIQISGEAGRRDLFDPLGEPRVLTETEANRWTDDLIEFMEANGMGLGGGFDGRDARFEFFITGHACRPHFRRRSRCAETCRPHRERSLGDADLYKVVEFLGPRTRLLRAELKDACR